jgi:hypothetical protein
MKKKTVITVIAVVGLLIVAFIGGSVFAQGDITSSAEGDTSKGLPPSVEEAPPSGIAQVSGPLEYSTVDGNAPGYVVADVAENEWHFVTDDQTVSSASDNASPDSEPTKVEPSLSAQEAVPDAPTWNSNIRYVGATLKPRSNTVNYDVGGTGGGCVYATGGDTSEVWNVPLSLPNGAIVETMRMYFYDNDAGNNLRGWFTKYDLYGDIVSEWGVWSMTSGYAYVDVPIAPAETINYNAFSYLLNFRPYAATSNLMLCGFRLFYTVYNYNFMPMVIKH